MTTTLTPPDATASDERALRDLSIAANLLPMEVVYTRRGRKVRRRVLAALVAIVALLAGCYSLASYEASQAQAGLDTAEAQARNLQHKQHDFDTVVAVQGKSKVISGQLTALLAKDLRWSNLINAVRKAAQEGVLITQIGGLVLTDPASSAGTTAPTVSAPLVGTFTIVGTAGTKRAVAYYVDRATEVLGIGNPLLNNMLVQDDGRVLFTVQLDIGPTALGGRYDAQIPSAAGGN